MTSTQPHRNGRHAKPEPPRAAPSIPLSPHPPPKAGEASLGDLVRDATRHFSTLIRSEVELAKAELAAEVRKGVKGSIMFIVALAILVFSLFFLFIAVAELLAVWLPSWAAYGIVFLLMVLAAGACALLGWRRMRSLSKPARTIRTVRDTGTTLTHRRTEPESVDPQLGPQAENGRRSEDSPDDSTVRDPVVAPPGEGSAAPRRGDPSRRE